MSLSRTQIVNWLTRCGDIFSTESEYLTGLDREIGDADHGLNMNRGFSKVVPVVRCSVPSLSAPHRRPRHGKA